MLRRICTLLFLLTTSAVLAAPAPKKSWEQYGWEKPIDPDNDCKFDIKEGTITIELPGGDHDFSLRRKRLNAPRLLRNVEGDFEVQVRVSASFHPSAQSSVKGQESRVAAGLLLMLTDKDFMRLDQAANRLKDDQPPIKTKEGPREGLRKGDLDGSAVFQMQGSQGMEVKMGTPWKPDPRAKEEHLYLYFERKGDNWCVAISPDGKKRTSQISYKAFPLPRKFKVGLAAYSTSTEPFKVHFDQFKLIRGGKESK